jgi:flagellar biosynthesis/type III secretory pathway M-ring protein FliF/YscJ
MLVSAVYSLWKYVFEAVTVVRVAVVVVVVVVVVVRRRRRNITEVAKLMEYMDGKEDPLIQIVRTHQRNTNSPVLQTARNLERGLQRGTRQIKNIISKKMKEIWQEKIMQEQFPRGLTKNWWIMNIHIDG